MIRIVKMQFKPEYVDEFLEIFNNSKELIRGFEGCKNLELYRDKKNTNILFTYSFWEAEEYLEKYRQSNLFKTTWAATRVLFEAVPEAWSVDREWKG